VKAPERTGGQRRRAPSAVPSVVRGVADLPLVDAEEMRVWDRRATERDGVVERVLMESAGRALAGAVQRLYPRGRVVGAVGRGHNGGDTLIALRTLAAWGREVVAVAVGGAEAEAGLLHGWRIEVAAGDDPGAAFRGADLILDGLLGTGATGAPREPHAGAIRAMNAAGRPIVAVDGPSGVDFSTGAVAGDAVRAAVTVTFGAPKRGLLLHPGRVHAGRLLAVEIGFPPLGGDEAGAEVVTPSWARDRMPRVPPAAHKGTMGDVVVVAGSHGVAGAAVLVGTGAARAGAGKVYLLSTAENREILQVALPEALFAKRASQPARELLARADAVVAGPGIGTDAAAAAVLRTLLGAGDAPLLLDADALTLVAREPALLDGADRPLLLTPHPGEMSRLLGIEVGEVTADPFAAAARAAERFRCTVLLKGAPSLVAVAGERTLASLAGHPGIATGGMGDTLGGVAGALLAVGCSPRDAAALALQLCGRAAEIAGRGRSLLPRDVAECLGDAITELEDPADDLDPGVILDLAAPG